jgi:hypothetical protein
MNPETTESGRASPRKGIGPASLLMLIRDRLAAGKSDWISLKGETSYRVMSSDSKSRMSFDGESDLIDHMNQAVPARELP